MAFVESHFTGTFFNRGRLSDLFFAFYANVKELPAKVAASNALAHRYRP
jgi:hypothetical protein